MNRKIIGIALIGFLLIITSGCTRVMTPDELIQPPELSTQSKEIRIALNEILPADYELVAFPKVKDTKENKSFIIKDIDGDGKVEAIALYRVKSEPQLGLILLHEVSGKWLKKYGVKIEALEVPNYRIEDLDQDGFYEIIIGHEDEKGEKKLAVFVQKNDQLVKIFDEDYYAMDIGNLRSGRYKNIVFSNYDEINRGNRVETLQLIKEKENCVLKKEGSLQYLDGTSPYGVQIGEMMPGKKAVFVDLLINQRYGKPDVLVFKDGKLRSYLQANNIEQPFQQSNLSCRDIDGDGIMEIPGTSTPALQNQDLSPHMKIYLMDYYKIQEDNTLLLVQQIYMDQYILNVQVMIPPEYIGNYTVSRTTDGNAVTFSYISKEKPVMIVPFMMLQKVDKNKWNQEPSQTVLSVSENTVTLGKLLSVSDRLSESDAAMLKEMIKISSDMSNFIKPAIR